MSDIRKAWRRAALTSLLALSTFTLTWSATAAEPPAAGTLKAGNMLIRLDRFLELRDGKVQADMSFHNLDTAAPASFRLPRRDVKGTRLTNAAGTHYRLVGISQLADSRDPEGWTSVPPGGSAAVTVTFLPQKAARGVQPFALAVPVRMKWQADGQAAERVRSFEVNFGGLRRAQPQAAPVERVERLALAPVQPPPAPAIEAFKDDLASRIAALRTTKPDPRRYLFAVGVNSYDDAPGVPFADRSARAMAELLRKRYGVPEENITLITDADATGIKILGRLNSLIQRLTPGDSVFFYYAGHGLTGRDGKAVYMVPKDAVPGAYEVDLLSLGSLLQRFEDSPATRVVAFLDTCFSGRIGRDQSLFPGAAPLTATPIGARPFAHGDKVTLFLAGQAHQFANDYPERGHRLFSYFVMDGLLRGHESPAGLNGFVAREVRRVSAKRGAEFLQEPRFEGTSFSFTGLPSKRRRENAPY